MTVKERTGRRKKLKWTYSKGSRIESAFVSTNPLVGDCLKCKLRRMQTIEIGL